MFGEYIGFIEKNLDVTNLKRKVISDNVANYSTPNYKATKVKFEHIFEENKSEGLKKTNDKHIASSFENDKPTLHKDNTTKERHDGNNVDLTNEMMEMMKNNSKHSKAIQAINKEFMMMKMALGR